MDVAAWLRGLSLERYGEAFRDNAIELEVLPELSEADLEVEMGERACRTFVGVEPSSCANATPDSNVAVF